MAGFSEGLFEPALPVRRPRPAGGVSAMAYLLCLLAVMAVGAVIAAATLGQVTAALCIGVVTGAFFAGLIC